MFDEWRYAKCRSCGKDFIRRRSDNIFCDATCRKRWSRRADGMKKAAQNISWQLKSIERDLERYPDLADECVALMVILRREVWQLTDKSIDADKILKGEAMKT